MAKRRGPSFATILKKAAQGDSERARELRAATPAKSKAKTTTRAARGKGPTLIQQSRRVPDEQKALYHQVLGAGKNRVKRPFLGLTQNDIDSIRQRVSDGIAKSLKDSGRT